MSQLGVRNRGLDCVVSLFHGAGALDGAARWRNPLAGGRADATRPAAIMAESKRTKRAKGDGPRAAVRHERRFLPVRDAKLTASLAVGAVGSVLLGAGVYIQFLRPADNAMAVHLGKTVVELADKGSFVVGAGAALLAGVILLAPDFETALLVGDGGVGVDTGGSEGVRRLLWCDIDAITLDKGALVVRGEGEPIVIPLSSQPQAAAWALREALERVPEVVKVSHEEQSLVPRADPEAGERRTIEGAQVAGRRCAASDKVISYEPDARLCPRCGEAYHKDSVPEACVTCDAPLGDEAQRVG